MLRDVSRSLRSVLISDLEKEARSLYGQVEKPSEKELEVAQEVKQ